MSAPEEKIEQVNIRDIWPHEALDFTPWLAKNLRLLGDALGMELELVKREAAVGTYSLDILAKEADTGVLVAIENQLEETNLTHLGQLLTYATGCDAHVAIWVAPEFGYYHAQALHRLNEWTSERIRFYGVKIEVVKGTGDSRAEPRFRKVVYPGCWNRDLTLPPERPSPPHLKQHHDFFQPLITKLLGENFAGPRQLRSYADRFFPSRLHPSTGYAVSLEWKNDAWVTLHIQTQDTEMTNRIFDALKEQRVQIEKCLEGEWHWRRWDKHTFSSINIRRDGSIDDAEKLEEIRAWMLEYLPKLKEVLDPHLERVLKELQPEGPAGAEA